MNKVITQLEEAVADISDGSAIGFGGFFTGGSPTWLIRTLAKRKVRDLTIVLQSVGVGNSEVNELIENDQVSRVIANYPFYRSVTKGKQHKFEQKVREGKIKVEVYPMGTFVEKLRAHGAGLGGFYTPSGVGTLVEQGKEKKTINGREYLLELALKLDFAFIHAWKGDYEGNLVYKKTSRNYSHAMAMAADITVAEVENLVKPGDLDPDGIHTPGVYVNRVVEIEKIIRKPGID